MQNSKYFDLPKFCSLYNCITDIYLQYYVSEYFVSEFFSGFAARCYAYVVMRYLSICPSTCPSCSCILSKWINISSIFSPSGSQIILVFPYQTLWQYSDGGIECMSQFSANICLHRMLSTIRPSSVIHTQLRWTMVSWWHLLLVSGIVLFMADVKQSVYDKSLNVTQRQQNRI